jgi:coenzyme F420-reducing hydrogenase delta subunit
LPPKHQLQKGCKTTDIAYKDGSSKMQKRMDLALFADTLLTEISTESPLTVQVWQQKLAYFRAMEQKALLQVENLQKDFDPAPTFLCNEDVLLHVDA